MSKVPYTVNVNEYVCDCLEQIRTMLKTHDFSALPAVVERIQFHANRMEAALYQHNDIKGGISYRVNKEDMSDAEFRDYVRGRVKKWTEDRD